MFQLIDSYIVEFKDIESGGNINVFGFEVGRLKQNNSAVGVGISIGGFTAYRGDVMLNISEELAKTK